MHRRQGQRLITGIHLHHMSLQRDKTSDHVLHALIPPKTTAFYFISDIVVKLIYKSTYSISMILDMVLHETFIAQIELHLHSSDHIYLCVTKHEISICKLI